MLPPICARYMSPHGRKAETLNPKAETRNPKAETLNPQGCPNPWSEDQRKLGRDLEVVEAAVMGFRAQRL